MAATKSTKGLKKIRDVIPGRPHGVRYPWARWFGLGSVTLVRGRDYHIMTHGLAQTARQAAARLGFSLRVEIGEGILKLTAARKG